MHKGTQIIHTYMYVYEYITRQQNKCQEQEDLPVWLEAQMSVVKQIDQPRLLRQKSIKTNLKGKKNSDQLIQRQHNDNHNNNH